MRDDATSDTDLMTAVARGDQRAFQALLDRHLNKAHAIAFRFLHGRDDAEEAVQDAFARVFVHAARFDPMKAGFSTWFYRILTRLCLDRLRRFRPPYSDIGYQVDEIADDRPDPEANLSQTSQARFVRKAVDSLPEAQKLAVMLCYFEDMTVPEAAKIMDKHIKALEGLLVRARKSLRTVLGDEHE